MAYYVISGRKLKERTWYKGVVSRYKETPNKLIISVVFDKDPDVEYIKSIEINESVNSPFARTAEALDIIDEFGRVIFEDLEDMRVLATLRRGKDDNLYVNKIQIDEDYYDALEEMDNEEGEGEKEE